MGHCTFSTVPTLGRMGRAHVDHGNSLPGPPGTFGIPGTPSVCRVGPISVARAVRGGVLIVVRKIRRARAVLGAGFLTGRDSGRPQRIPLTGFSGSAVQAAVQRSTQRFSGPRSGPRSGPGSGPRSGPAHGGSGSEEHPMDSNLSVAATVAVGPDLRVMTLPPWGYRPMPRNSAAEGDAQRDSVRQGVAGDGPQGQHCRHCQCPQAA